MALSVHTSRSRTLISIAAAFLLIGGLLVHVTSPPAPLRLGVLSGASTVRGALHIHTTRSDGTLAKRDVAAAAARAGLQFAIFTEHGDATTPPDPPAYIDGVLCLDGVEISTNDGHYLALGLPVSPYRLGGDARAVVEDVARLGGFGLAAHPFSAREELSWSDWEPQIDGLEWMNADSEWREEGGLMLTRALLAYFWRPPGALARLLDRPEGALAMWDRLTSTRPVVGLAGHDAHGGFGAETGESSGRRLHLPSYEAAFRTFSLVVQLPAAPTGEAARDAGTLLEALRRGSVLTAIDALATPAAVEFSARGGGEEVGIGGMLPIKGGPAIFTVRASAPSGATTVLLRNGTPVLRKAGGALDYESNEPGAFRVEVHLNGAPGTPPVPWIVTNPIYRLLPAVELESGMPVRLRTRLDPSWRVELGGGSFGTVSRNDGGVTLSYSLGAGTADSPFAALATDFGRDERDRLAGVERFVFGAAAEAPMRVSLQVRFAGDREQRWGRSIYLDKAMTEVEVPLSSLRPADRRVGERPPISRATSLLFVVDLTNARPGQRGSFTVSDVFLQERAP